MTTELSTETQFWLILNVILLTIIITLGMKLFRKRKLKTCHTPFSASWTTLFDDLTHSEGASKAITVTFSRVIGDLENHLGLGSSGSLTSREVLFLMRSKLGEDIMRDLMRLYEIYEPIRFGGKNAEEEDSEEFRRILIRLADRIQSSGVEA